MESVSCHGVCFVLLLSVNDKENSVKTEKRTHCKVVTISLECNTFFFSILLLLTKCV